MSEIPQLFDAAPDLYESAVKRAKEGHSDTCDTALVESMGMADCTCGHRELMKTIAYARGDDPLEVDEGTYNL
jgi:hypothetical protein